MDMIHAYVSVRSESLVKNLLSVQFLQRLSTPISLSIRPVSLVSSGLLMVMRSSEPIRIPWPIHPSARSPVTCRPCSCYMHHPPPRTCADSPSSCTVCAFSCLRLRDVGGLEHVPYKLVEWVKRAEACLDHGEQPLTIAVMIAPSLTSVKL